ncbi:uncharacterized protein LOC142550779 [Primulina tabacum]|uniref:uncharacterized protein LOC142550779 n=1 Tax=Primulina tabacum TaxID=48773 RepID=UPI003F59DECD
MHNSLDSTKNRIEAEIEKQRSEQNATNEEIMMLRQQQESTQKHLVFLKHRLNITTMKQYLIIFFMESLKDPMFMQNFIEKMKKKRAPLEILKKRWLNSCDSGDCNLIESPKIVDAYIIDDVSLDEKTVLSSDESGSYLLNQKAEASSETSNLGECHENCFFWEKLMEDDIIYQEEEEMVVPTKKQSDLVLELEDLIGTPSPSCPASIA